MTEEKPLNGELTCFLFFFVMKMFSANEANFTLAFFPFLHYNEENMEDQTLKYLYLIFYTKTFTQFGSYFHALSR